jgi:hypothetical protein
MRKTILTVSWLSIFILAAAISLAGCQQMPSPTEPLQDTGTIVPENQAAEYPPGQTSEPPAGQVPQQSDLVFGLTYQESNGNRLIPGTGTVLFQNMIDLPLPDDPTWLVAVPGDNGITWFAALENGTIFSVFITFSGLVEAQPRISEYFPGMPLAAMSDLNRSAVIAVTDPEQSQLSHPVFLPSSGLRAYITASGGVRFMDTSDQVVSTLDIHALPDARILVDNQERLLVLSDATDMYSHGVLGDQLEARSISLIETAPEIRTINRITLDDDEVIEGIAPIWSDLNNDSLPEIIVTISDPVDGAGIVVFDEGGQRIASGPKIGQPFRWRHQIAVADFGPAGETELAVVRTPHIGGSAEFYQLKNGELILVAEFPNITSHAIGSRNLDSSAAGDIDGDGTTELLVLSQDFKEYIAIQRTPDGAEEAWRLALDGRLSTNPVGVPLPNGQFVLGIGRADGVLRLWMP